MKKSVKIFAIALLSSVSITLFAQDQTATFKVAGVCSMCKKSIEKAGKVPGVTSVTWDENKQQAKVQFNQQRASLDQIQKSIAAAGYDTEKFKASDSAFRSLPDCCQYERTKSVSKN